MLNFSEAASQERLGEFGLVEKIEGFEQGFGVRLGGLRKGPDDPGVAALLFDVAQRLPRPPENGVPPVERRHGELEDPHAMIAAPQVRKLMNEQRPSLPLVEALPELDRDDQPRAAPKTPRASARACRRSTRPAGDARFPGWPRAHRPSSGSRSEPGVASRSTS